MALLTAKSSTILTCIGGTTHSYRSLDEMPLEARQRVEQAISGSRVGTIIMADERGMEELARALNGNPGTAHSLAAEHMRRHAESTRPEPLITDQVDPQINRVPSRLRIASEYLVPALVGLSLWWLVTIRF